MTVEDLVCPVCDGVAEAVDGTALYGRAILPGKVFYRCAAGCDCHVGAHRDGRPLGSLAGPALRRARQRAHEMFDPWWKSRGLTRTEAYGALPSILGVPKAKAHIAMFDAEQCALVVDVFRPTKKERLTRGSC